MRLIEIASDICVARRFKMSERGDSVGFELLVNSEMNATFLINSVVDILFTGYRAHLAHPRVDVIGTNFALFREIGQKLPRHGDAI